MPAVRMADNQADILAAVVIVSFATACVMAILTYLGTAHIPQYWSGGMDGYFYGLMIKTYLNSFTFSALDMEHPLTYSPYFFYLLGMIGRVTHITDLGQLQIIGFILAFGGLPIITYCVLRPVVAPAPLMLMMALFYLFGGFDDNHWQKSHEIISLTGIPALLVYLENLKRERFTSKVHRLFCGIVAGASFGIYAAFTVIPFVSAGIIALGSLLFANKQTRPRILPFVFDWYFIIPAIGLALPYVLTTLIAVLTHDQGTGFVFAFSSNEVHFNFLDLKWENLSYFIGLGLCAFVAFQLFTQKEVNATLLYGSLMVLIGVSVYSYMVYGFYHHQYFTAPFKFYAHIPLATAFMAGSLPRVAKATEAVLKKVDLFPGILIGSMLSVTLACMVMSHTYKTQEINNSLTGYMDQRARYLLPVILYINQTKRVQKLERYIGSGTATFLDYYVPGKFVNHFMYNESYASLYENLMDRAARLRDASSKGAEALYDQLKHDKVDILVLQQTVKDMYGVYFTHNDEKTMEGNIGVPQRLLLPVNLFQDMVAKGHATLTRLFDYDIYILR